MIFIGDHFLQKLMTFFLEVLEKLLHLTILDSINKKMNFAKQLDFITFTHLKSSISMQKQKKS